MDAGSIATGWALGQTERAARPVNHGIGKGTATMKAYLATTGALWSVLAIAHGLRTFAEWGRMRSDPGFLVEGPGIGLLAAGLCLWAWRLFARARVR